MTDSRKQLIAEDAEHRHWMAQAIALARQAEALGEVPVGAIIVSDGEIIGQGWNQPITQHDPSAHAEIQALRDACRRRGNYRLPDARMYVTIEPCTMCAGAIVHARLDALIYGASEPRAGAISSHLQVLEQPYLNTRVQSLGGIMAEECAELLTRFFRARRQ